EGSHSPSDQLPIPGKGSPSGTTSPSHDAVPGLTIPKRILSHEGGSKHLPSDALPIASKPNAESEGSASSAGSVFDLPMKNVGGSDHSRVDQLPITGKLTSSEARSGSRDAVAGLSVAEKLGNGEVTEISSSTASDDTVAGEPVLNGVQNAGSPGEREAGNDAVSESLPVSSKVIADSLPSVSSPTPRPATAEKESNVSPTPPSAPSPAPQAASAQTVFVSIPRRRSKLEQNKISKKHDDFVNPLSIENDSVQPL
ncbi:hypothetical protein T4D_8114, partial [Trichinella pseudospiralis]